MTYDPNRMQDYPNRVVGYGADRHSASYYAMLVVGVLVAMAAIFYLIGDVGGKRPMHANVPLEKSTTGQATTETPGLLPTAPRQ